MVKKGFTLSEVLIALAIIGVLAAVLIPTVQKTMPDKSIAMFKKSYNTLLTAISNMINDDANYPATQTITISSIAYQKGFNYTTATINGSSAKFPYLLADSLNTVGSTSIIDRTATGQSSFTTSDGATWTVYVPKADSANDSEDATSAVSSSTVQFPILANEYTTKVIIDVDGPTKGSNCSADTGFVSPFVPTAGSPSPAYRICNNTDADAATKPCKNKPDTFVMGVRYDGKVQAACTTAAGTTCLPPTSPTAPTDACANWILTNPTTQNN